jgi:hypothetical protein
VVPRFRETALWWLRRFKYAESIDQEQTHRTLGMIYLHYAGGSIWKKGGVHFADEYAGKVLTSGCTMGSILWSTEGDHHTHTEGGKHPLGFWDA